MGSPYALFRLMWRPLLPAMLFMVALAAAFPMLLLDPGDGWDPLRLLWDRSAEPVVRSAAWRLVILVSAAAGAMLSTVRQEVAMSGLAWSLPGVRRGWQSATLIVALPVSGGLGWLVYRGGPPAEAVAAIGLSAFWFLVPGALMLAGLPRGTKAALGGLLIASVAFATQVHTVVAGAPWTVAMLAVVGAVLLFRHQFSAATARKQSSLEEVLARMWDRGFLWWSFSAKGEWGGRLQDARMVPWLLAAGHESGHGSLFRYARSVAWAALIFGLVVRLLGGAEMLPLYVGMMIGGRALQLQSALPYPLSRRARADLAFIGGIVEASLLAFGMLLVLWCLSIVDFPILAQFELHRNEVSLSTALAVSLAWLPIMIWGSIRPMQLQMHPRQLPFVTRIGAFILYIVLAMGSLEVLRWEPAGRAGQDWRVWALVSAGLFTYPALWWVTRRHFAKADLAAAGP